MGFQKIVIIQKLLAFLKYIFEENRYANAVNIMSPLKESSQTQKILKEMEQLDIPIITYTDYILQQSLEYANLENEYLNIKKELGLDARFSQNFIIEDDIESLINNTNKKWIEKIKGNNSLAVFVATYGNRDYEYSLL